MQTTFLNKLTKDNISRGVSLHIKNHLWPLILVAMVAVFTLVHYLIGLSTSAAAVTAIVAAVAASGWLNVSLGRNFSPEKVASYTLGDEAMAITGSDGTTHRYPYGQIRALQADAIILLRLPKGSFAILSMDCMSDEQVEFVLTQCP